MKFSLIFFAIISAVQAVTFNCTFELKNIVGTLGENYECDVASISNFINHDLTAVYGVHESEKSNNDVKVLRVSKQPNLTFIPNKIENFFPNLIGIFFDENAISNLSGSELDPFGEKLRAFGISKNPALDRIPGNFFSLTPNVEYIYFGYNSIKLVGDGFLDSLSKLIAADFTGNVCIDELACDPDEVKLLNHTLVCNCSCAALTATTSTILPSTTTTTKLTTTSTTTPSTTTTTTTPTTTSTTTTTTPTTTSTTTTTTPTTTSTTTPTTTTTLTKLMTTTPSASMFENEAPSEEFYSCNVNQTICKLEQQVELLIEENCELKAMLTEILRRLPDPDDI